MAKKNKEDEATIKGIKHILGTLMELTESQDMEKMCSCLDNLVADSKKLDLLSSVLNIDNEEFLRMSSIIEKVVADKGDE